MANLTFDQVIAALKVNASVDPKSELGKYLQLATITKFPPEQLEVLIDETNNYEQFEEINEIYKKVFQEFVKDDVVTDEEVELSNFLREVIQNTETVDKINEQAKKLPQEVALATVLQVNAQVDSDSELGKYLKSMIVMQIPPEKLAAMIDEIDNTEQSEDMNAIWDVMFAKAYQDGEFSQEEADLSNFLGELQQSKELQDKVKQQLAALLK